MFLKNQFLAILVLFLSVPAILFILSAIRLSVPYPVAACRNPDGRIGLYAAFDCPWWQPAGFLLGPGGQRSEGPVDARAMDCDPKGISQAELDELTNGSTKVIALDTDEEGNAVLFVSDDAAGVFVYRYRLEKRRPVFLDATWTPAGDAIGLLTCIGVVMVYTAFFFASRGLRRLIGRRRKAGID